MVDDWIVAYAMRGICFLKCVANHYVIIDSNPNLSSTQNRTHPSSSFPCFQKPQKHPQVSQTSTCAQQITMNPANAHEGRSVEAFLTTTTGKATRSYCHPPTLNPGFVALVTSNNDGARFFEERNYVEAISCFRRALEHSKNIARLQEETESWIECHGGGVYHPEEATEEELMLSGISFHFGVLTVNSSHPKSESDFFMVQDACIRLVPENRLVFATDLKHLATIVVYNCALTLHMQGSHLSSKKLLEKALALYSHGLALITSNSASQGGPGGQTHCLTGNPLLDFVHLALVNNMGIIMRRNSHAIDKSQAVFGWLVTLVRAFISTYDSPSSGNTISTRVQQGGPMSLLFQIADEFLLNAVAFQCSPRLMVCAPSA
jgi:hypothetical protein